MSDDLQTLCTVGILALEHVNLKEATRAEVAGAIRRTMGIAYGGLPEKTKTLIEQAEKGATHGSRQEV